MKKYEMGIPGKYDKQNKWDTPNLIELWRTAPYMHDGRYTFLQDVFVKDKHGLKTPLSDNEVQDLVDYLLSL